MPGCVTFGNSLDHAQKMAQEVLELWLETLADLGKPIPVEKKPANIYVSRMKVSLANSSK